MRTFAMMALVISCGAYVASQQLSSQMRARELAASFSKHKDVEKYGIRKYKDVRSEPLLKQNTRDYSGSYEVKDLGFVIKIEVGSDGQVQASGYENRQQLSRTFKLENARIDGALLSGTKVYQDGTAEKLEGVFLTRTDRETPTSAGVTVSGLGVVLTTPFEINGQTYDKLFYSRVGK
jgi:hypothetical protein